MTKSRQDFHRNAEELAKKFRRRAAKMLKITENPLLFSLRRDKIWPKKDKINSLIEQKSGILRKLSYHKSLERFHFLLYVIVVIKRHYSVCNT